MNRKQIISQSFNEKVFENESCFVKKVYFLEKRRFWKAGNKIAFDAYAYDGIDAFIKGAEGVKIEYTNIGNFHEGLAKVKIEGKGFGFVNEDLALVVPAKYHSVRDFNNSYAVVSALDNENGERKILFIDKGGNEYFFEKDYERVSDKEDGMFMVSDSTIPESNLAFHSDYEEFAGVWGYADCSGKEIIKPQYIYALGFISGLALVCKGEWKKDKKWNNKYKTGAYWTETELWGAIDKTGKEIIPCKFDEIRHIAWFGESQYLWAHYGGWKEGKWGIINYTGEWLVEPIFEDFGYEFSDDGLFTFYNEDKWNADEVPTGIYSIKEQRVLFEPQFLDVDFFCDGIIKVEVYDEKLKRNIEKLIDYTGKTLFDSRYISIYKQYNIDSMFEVSIPGNAGKWLRGLIDKNGNEIVPCKYKTRFDGFLYEQKLIIFEENEKYGIVTFDDNVIVPPQYTSIVRTGSKNFPDVFEVSSGGTIDHPDKKRGLIAMDGSAILPIEYDNIFFQEYCIIAENDSGATIYMIFGKITAAEEAQLDDIANRLEELTRIELEYFRDWLMNHYPIFAMAHDIGTIIQTIEGVGADYDEIDSMLKDINDHSKWEIEESVYIEEEKSGYYQQIELDIELDNLEENEWAYIEELLEKRHPGYIGSSNKNLYYRLSDTSGEDGEPTVEEVLEIIKEAREHCKSKNEGREK